MPLILSTDVGRALTPAEMDSNMEFLSGQTASMTSAVTTAAGAAATSASQAVSAANTAASSAASSTVTNITTAIASNQNTVTNAVNTLNTGISNINTTVASFNNTASTAVTSINTASTTATNTANTALSTLAASLTNNTVYADIPTGLAATANNGYFDVIGDNVLTSRVRYQRLTSTTYQQVVSYPATTYVSNIKAYTDALATNSLSSNMYGSDDIFWSRMDTDSANNVLGGRDITGKSWEYLMEILTLVMDNASLNQGGIIKFGNFDIFWNDTQYDVVLIDKNGYPQAGTINGVPQSTGAGTATLTDGTRWAPSTAVNSSMVKALPNGTHGVRAAGSPGTTRPLFDATESSYWLTTGSRVRHARQFSRSCILPAPNLFQQNAMLNGFASDAGAAGRKIHKASFGATNIQLVYHAFSQQHDVDTSGPLQVKASIEYPLGTYHKVHFVGESSTGYVTIPPGSFAVSLPVGVQVPASATIAENWSVIPSSGGNYPTGQPYYGGTDSIVFNTTADYTATTNPGGGTTGFSYGAAALCGIPFGGSTALPFITTLGDSISAGVGSSNPGGGGDGGIIQYACQQAGTIAYMSLGNNGYTASGLAGNMPHIMEMIAGCTDVCIIAGTNDLSNTSVTAAQLLANLQIIGTTIINMGLRAHFATIPPRTTSTDTWTTVNNQTPINANFGPEVTGGSPRQIVNTALRANPSWATSVYDIASVLEVLNSSNSYVWNTNTTLDGIHPYQSTGIYAQLAPLVPTALFG